MVKNPPATAGDAGLIPGLERSPGGGNATHSRSHVWESPWTEEPESLQSIGLQRVRLNLATKLQDSSVHLWKYMRFSVLWQRRLFFPFCAPLPTVLVSFSSLSARLPRWPLLTSGLCCIMTKLPGKKGQILS